MVYLDYAASTPLLPEVKEVMLKQMDDVFGNPSSIHAFGRKSKVVLENSRRQIAKMLNVSPSEIFFTSGGTEANNTILAGACRDLGIGRFVSSALEHPAVLQSLEWLARYHKAEVLMVDIDAKGRIDLGHLDFLLKDAPRSLVTLMHANNEIGNLLPVKEVQTICKKHHALFHSDSVQTIGKFKMDMKTLGFDFASCSAHKFFGPKGVGFMYISGKHRIKPLIWGGGQELNMRAGTENIHGIAGMTMALKLAQQQADERLEKVKTLRAVFMEKSRQLIPGLVFNGDAHGSCLPHIVSFSLPETSRSEMLLLNLDVAGFAVSGGSACSSGASKGSHVLHALGVGSDIPSLRVSFSHLNTMEEVEAFLMALKDNM